MMLSVFFRRIRILLTFKGSCGRNGFFFGHFGKEHLYQVLVAPLWVVLSSTLETSSIPGGGICWDVSHSTLQYILLFHFSGW